MDQSSESSSLHFVCFNVAGHWFSPNDPPNIAGRVVRIAEKISSLQPPVDLVCIQELYSLSFGVAAYKSERNAFLDAMRLNGFEHVAQCASSWFGMDSGLLIVSKLPLADVKCIVFSSQATLASSKGAICATVQMPNGRKIDVCVAHVAWGSHVEVEQRAQLREFVLKSSANPLVVCGDFNGRPFEGDACSLCDLGATHVDGGKYDHATGRNGAQIRADNVHNWDLSDHYALEFHVDNF